MEQSLIEFRDQYKEKLLSFLWKQWTSLGVQGYEESQDKWVIDPEALLLFSCNMARHDPRLFDEILDWLQVNGRFINVQRLRKILHKEDFVSQRVISAIAGFMSEHHKYMKWRGFERNQADYSSTENLFTLKETVVEPFGKFDPVFQRYGLIRGEINLRAHTKPVRGNSSPGFLFKLRSILGVNARCEILLFLLTHEDGAHPSWVAKETYYSQKAVQDLLVDMTYSGLIQTYRIGRQKRYMLKPKEWFNFLKLSNDSLLWISWPSIFSALEKIWLKLNDKDIIQMDPLLLSSTLRSLMQEVRSKIERSGFAKTLSDDQSYLGESYTQAFMNDINSFLSGSLLMHWKE